MLGQNTLFTDVPNTEYGRGTETHCAVLVYLTFRLIHIGFTSITVRNIYGQTKLSAGNFMSFWHDKHPAKDLYKPVQATEMLKWESVKMGENAISR